MNISLCIHISDLAESHALRMELARNAAWVRLNTSHGSWGEAVGGGHERLARQAGDGMGGKHHKAGSHVGGCRGGHEGHHSPRRHVGQLHLLHMHNTHISHAPWLLSAA